MEACSRDSRDWCGGLHFPCVGTFLVVLTMGKRDKRRKRGGVLSLGDQVRDEVLQIQAPKPPNFAVYFMEAAEDALPRVQFQRIYGLAKMLEESEVTR